MSASNAGSALPFSSVSDQVSQLNDRLVDYLSKDHEIVADITTRFIQLGGKRLRPALVLLSAGASGMSSDENRFRYALVVELIHFASLFHDDVIDEASLRRGFPSANRVLGNHLSILVGDYLYSKALALLIPDREDIQWYVNNTVTRMTEGEILQAMNRWDDSGGEDLYLRIIERKTAELMSLACRLGASITGDDNLSNRFARYGWNIGMAFQLIDDLLDWTAEEHKLNKNCFQDIREGRITLPALLLRDRLPSSERDEFIKRITSDSGDLSEDILKKYRQAMFEHDIINLVKARARQFSRDAVNALKGLPDTPYLSDLVSLPEVLLERDH